MSTSTTTNLGLVLDNADEPVKTHHRHANANLATLDVTIKSLQDSMGNAKALLGQLGIDAEDHYVVDAETARTTLGVPSLSDIGDIVRQNIPLMSPTTLGGAKLEAHGGLALRDGALGIGSLVQQSDGYARGGLAEVTAKGHAEQDGTPTPESPVEIQVVRGRNLLHNTATSQTINGVTFTVNSDGSVTANGTANAGIVFFIMNGETIPSGSYYITGCPTGGSASTYGIRIGSSVLQSDLSDYGQGRAVPIPSDAACRIYIFIASGHTCSNLTFYPQLEVGPTAHPYVPYGHVGMEVQGKNLFNPSYLLTDAGWTKSDGVYTGQSSKFYAAFANGYPALTFEQDVQYTFSFDFDYSGDTGTAVVCEFLYTDGTRSSSYLDQKNHHYAVVSTSGKTVSKFILGYGTKRTASMSNIQLELGSTATEYRPYFEPTCTPIPLPSRGWVGSIPDGTADTLTLDGAGKVEWEERCNEKKFSELSWSVSHNYSIDRFGTTIADKRKPSSGDVRASDLMSDCYIADGAGAIAGNVDHRISGYQNSTDFFVTDSDYSDVQAFVSARGNTTVLYPLATPVTESLGYIDLPSIDGDCQISIPELDALGVRYFVDDSAGTLARQWYERAQSEYADRITALEQAVAELATS